MVKNGLQTDGTWYHWKIWIYTKEWKVSELVTVWLKVEYFVLII